MASEIRIGMLGSVDSGKCFAINTPILMYNNTFKMIQDISKGDMVMSDNNRDYKVVINTVRGKSKMYTVTQSHGMHYTVNSEHILSLKLISYEKNTVIDLHLYLSKNTTAVFNQHENVIDISVSDYIKLPINYKKCLYGYKSNSYDYSMIIVSEESQIDYYYGISLEDENKRFQLADHTVVHNSTFTGVISKNTLDNGRGLARSLILKHPHEKSSGRTSDISQHYIRKGDKCIAFVDLAGHEKYLKTTITGISKCYIDYACVVVASNMGVLRMTREHIGILVGLQIPFFIILTKIDLCPENVKENTLKDIYAIFSKFSKIKKINIKKTPVLVTDNEYKYNINDVPIFPVSSVTGINIQNVKDILIDLPSNTQLEIHKNENTNFIIESVYVIKGIGFVVSGLLIRGTIRVNDILYLGPYYGQFYKIQIKSIHNNFRESIPLLESGCSGCLNFKYLTKDTLKRSSIRKGVKILTNPVLIREFEARVKILYHHTSIKQGYQPLIHCGNISQIATIQEIDKDLVRLYDQAIIRFQFKYYPEYMEEGVKILFREGKTKGTGIVTKILN